MSTVKSPTYNGAVPDDGPIAVYMPVHLSAGSMSRVDLRDLYSRGFISGIQAMYVDLSQIPVDVHFYISDTMQRIICKAGTQGYYPILSTTQYTFDVKATVDCVVPVHFLNFAIASGTWGNTASNGNGNGSAGLQLVAGDNINIDYSGNYATISAVHQKLIGGDNVNLTVNDDGSITINAASAGSAPTYVAGSGISIVNDKINTNLKGGTNISLIEGDDGQITINSTASGSSGSGTEYQAGDGISIEDDTISANLIAGDNITLTKLDGYILIEAASGGGTEYSAGQGISLDSANNRFSLNLVSEDDSVHITSGENDAVALSVDVPNLVAGDGIDITHYAGSNDYTISSTVKAPSSNYGGAAFNPCPTFFLETNIQSATIENPNSNTPGDISFSGLLLSTGGKFKPATGGLSANDYVSIIGDGYLSFNTAKLIEDSGIVYKSFRVTVGIHTESRSDRSDAAIPEENDSKLTLSVTAPYANSYGFASTLRASQPVGQLRGLGDEYDCVTLEASCSSRTNDFVSIQLYGTKAVTVKYKLLVSVTYLGEGA